MKKYCAAVLIFCIIFGFSGCGKNETDVKSNKSSNSINEDTLSSEENLIDDADDENYYKPTDVPIESEKAVASKFNVDMDIYVTDTVQKGDNVEFEEKTMTEIPLNMETVGLRININNDEIFIVCSGYWRLEKSVDGKYVEIKGKSSDDEENSRSGPNSKCYVNCDLTPYKGLIEKGKYRFISPTLNIAKETENGLEAYTYQNEKSFILYKEFEFTDEDKSLNSSSKQSVSNSNNVVGSVSSRYVSSHYEK